MLILVLALSLLLPYGNCQVIDADKAAELSREIREHFRRSGANWVSPKMLHSEIDLARNVKPMMFVFTSRSCSDCRNFMASWEDLDPTTVSSITAQFVSVLALDDYQLEVTRFSPPEIDYLPRVLFADPDGTLRLDIKNSALSDNGAGYYYDNAQQVVEAMRRFLQQHWEDVGTDVFRGDLESDIM